MRGLARGSGKGGGRPCGAPMPVYHRVIDASLPNVRQSLIDIRHRFETSVPDDTLARTELVLAEVLNNIVQHGTGAGKEAADGAPPPIRVVVHVTVTGHQGGLACAVTDDGAPLPDACRIGPRVAPTPEGAALCAGGFGWYIIRDLTRSLFYLREGRRNLLCFNIPRSQQNRRSAGAADVA